MRGNLLVAAAILLGACGYDRPADVVGDGGTDAGPEAAACTNTSGTRLRVRKRQHADGTGEFIRTIDMQTGKECHWATAIDGKLRCMPLADGYSDGFVKYSDPACSTVLLEIYSNRIEPGQPMIGNDGADGPGSLGGCATTRRMFDVGAEVTPGATIYVHDGAGGCSPTPPQSGIYKYFTAGEELAPTMWIEGTRTHLGANRIWLESIDGEDGSRYCQDTYNAFHDRDLDDGSCFITHAYDDKDRCMPNSSGAPFLGQFYSDSTCSTAQEVVATAKCKSPSGYAASFAMSECGFSTSRMRRTGSAVTIPLFTTDSMGLCRAAPTSFTYNELLINIVDESTFAEAMYEWVDAGERLQRQDVVVGDARMPTKLWHDKTLMTDCRFDVYQSADGVPRCSPWGSVTQQVADASYGIFTAADCSPASKMDYATTNPLPPRPCLGPELPPRYVVRSTPEGAYEFFHAGTEAPAGTYYIESPGGGCEPLVAGVKLYTIGTSIQTELVTGTEVTE